MHQTKKCNQYHFGAKAHIGVDDESGLVHSVVVTAANVAEITQINKLLHGDETVVCADAGYTGVQKREEHAGRHVIWQIASRQKTWQTQRIVQSDAQDRESQGPGCSKVEHPFRLIKRQFGYTRVRFRGLVKNSVQMMTLFAL